MSNNPLDDDNTPREYLPSLTAKVARKPRKTLISTRLKKPRKPRNEIEQKIQISFFIWARLKSTLLDYPLLDKLLFSVPNGGKRSARTAQTMKDEGVEAGVADVLFLVPARGYSYLCMEFKAPKGRKSGSQDDFERAVDKVGGLYQVVYSVDQAKALLRWYYADIKL